MFKVDDGVGVLVNEYWPIERSCKGVRLVTSIQKGRRGSSADNFLAVALVAHIAFAVILNADIASLFDCVLDSISPNLVA